MKRVLMEIYLLSVVGERGARSINYLSEQAIACCKF